MSQEELEKLRHSLAHLLAAAIRKLYPDAKRTIGPAVENGFYYDFDFGDVVVSEKDLPKIEKKMKDLLPTFTSFNKEMFSKEAALEFYKDNPYKQELIEEFTKDSSEVSFYASGSFKDLCRGGHAESLTSYDPEAFKLERVAGAYWRGDEKNKMLTRIYGVAFATKEELREFVVKQEEAAKRDHKKLGKELGLFTFSETIGKGLPLWTVKGSIVRRILERFTVDEEVKRGYVHVYTPDIANLALYKKSGHYPYYKDSMYSPIVIDNDEYMLRPMTCPHHFELYLSEPHSYKDLPMRIAELAHLYRYEQSGELMGLLRVRTFTLADAHIIVRKTQALDEINGVLDLIDYVCTALGLKQGENYRYRLSMGDRADESKYYKDDEAWQHAEDVLESVLKTRNSIYYKAENEAAFYGPKIDIQMKNVNGKEDTAFTVQYDFVMPKRFGLTFTNEQGQDEEPVVVHRSSIGCIERVFAFLIEHYAGNFPLWLAPTQIVILPISDKQNEFADTIKKELLQSIPDLRIDVDSRSESIGKKIRDTAKLRAPYQIILGQKEVDENVVAIRTRSGEDLGQMSVEAFVQKIKNQIETRS